MGIDNVFTEKINLKYTQLIHKSNVEHHRGDNKKALEYTYLAYMSSKKDHKIKIETKVQISILYCIRMQDYDLRSYWKNIKKILIDILEVTSKNELFFYKAKILYILADYTYLKRDFEEYHKYYGQLIDILNVKFSKFFVKSSISELFSMVYLSRAMYLLSNDSSLSLSYIKKGLIEYKYNKNNFLRMRLYIQLGRYYWYKKDEKCLLIFKSILQKTKKKDFIKQKYHQWDDLILEVLFTMSSSQVFFKYYNEALESCREALRVSRAITSIEMEAETLVLMCKILLKKDDIQENSEIFNDAYNFCNKNNYQDLLEDLKTIQKEMRNKNAK